jgi:preprotein translocase subunit SecF
MSIEIIKPGASYEFVGRRQVFFALSGALVLASLISLAVLGFNRGIDFKGGTKIIVAFKPDATVDRDALRGTLDELVRKETGREDAGQIEVQDFDTGSGGGGGKKNFMLLTELTSLVTAEQKKTLEGKLRGVFGDKAIIDVAAEGEDRFDVTVSEKIAVKKAYDDVKAAFAEAGFPKVTVSSDVERQIDVNNYKSLQLLTEEGGEASEAARQREANFEADKDKALQTAKDSRFTITIEEFKAKLETTLKDKFGDGFIRVESSTSVSPSVAGDMLNQGLVAILYAILGIVLYIMLRFDIRYAPGAIVALAHDVILVTGAFSVAQIKFTMPIIAAVLTIAGYSINDTIVVFDRIRETIDKFKGAPMEKIINHAINSTLSRTLLTSITTLMAVLSIFLLGGGLIRDFAFAMCIGIVVGTYSSIFVASPLFLALHSYFEERESADAGGRAAAAAASAR